MISNTDTVFVNNFWDEKDQGFNTISTRVKNSTATMQELLDYYLERINIEKEYTKKLDRLNLLPIGSNETGILKRSLDKLNYENNQMAKFNNKFIKSVNQINYDKLSHFYVMYTKRTKKLMSHMNKIVGKKTDILKDLQITKEAYKQNCSQIKSLGLSIQTTWGKELEKNEKKLNKLKQNLSNTERNYNISIENYTKINDIFKRDWSLALSEIYQLEIERIQLIKINCFNFCNNIATLCVDNDQSADLARSFFAKISPPQDLQDFSDNYGTGDKIFSHPKFINFMEGFDDGNDRSFEIAEFEVPEFNHLLSRSYSTYSLATQQSQNPNSVQSSHSVNSSPTTPKAETFKSMPSPPKENSSPKAQSKPSSPIKEYLPASPPREIKKFDLPKPEDTRSNYSNFSPDEKTDIFSIKSHKFTESNGSSNYSNPTNYSSSNSERHWASPRRKEKQISQFQDKINIKSKELPTPKSNGASSETITPVKTPLTKDFSIDFIAKALEDLNSGGNGDVNRYRRSIRIAKPQEVDENEVPTRYDTISFRSPKAGTTDDGSPVKQARPKSMYESIGFDAAKSVSPRSRATSRPRSLNLNSIISKITPVNKRPYIVKAKAKYSYKPQHNGELYFRKGWHIYVIHKQPDNWFLCELGDNCEDKEGLVGLVPGNYIVEGDDVF